MNGVLERERLISEQEENERLKAKRKARELGPQGIFMASPWSFMAFHASFLHFLMSSGSLDLRAAGS